jgi:Ni/Fe-hydrogenase subunit HybB-like protein
MATRQLSLKRPSFTPLMIWLGGLAVLLFVGVIGAINVLINGLQVTGLTDQVPWGLWITIDLSSIALGAGAFTFSAVVYVFRIKRFEPIARPAVFVGFLGYSSAMIALALDIGRPDRFWHPLVFWNVHSVLWEITWCVVLYSSVLVVEFLPVLFESKLFDRWSWLRDWGRRLHKATPIVAILGMALSLLHQSSLGATYGVLSGRAIWFKPSLPILFILSAVSGGIALTLLAAVLVGKFQHTRFLRVDLQREISRFLGYALLAYLYLKIWDWAATSYYSHAPGTAESLARLNATTPYTPTFWLLEIALGALFPVIVMLVPRLRRDDRWVIAACFTVIIGVIINRWNTTLSGLVAPPDWSPGVLGTGAIASYIPSITEVVVGLGILAYALGMFTLGVKYLPVFHKESDDA